MVQKYSFDEYILFILQNTNIKLLAAVYDVRGEFLRWEQVGGGNLQVRHQIADSTIGFLVIWSFTEHCN